MIITVRGSSIPEMLQLVKDIENGHQNHRELKRILDGPDYQMEFSRYGSSVPKETFEAYLMDCPGLEAEQIQNVALKTHHKYWTLEYYNGIVCPWLSDGNSDILSCISIPLQIQNL